MREAGLEVNGTALSSVAFVKVRWERLTLVALQVVLSTLFLLAVVIGTTRLGVDAVKSTNTAELFALRPGCPGECRERVAGFSQGGWAAAYSGIGTEVGRDLKARLVSNHEGWTLEVRTRAASTVS